MTKLRIISSLMACLFVVPPSGGPLRAIASNGIDDPKAAELSKLLGAVAQYEHGASREVLEDLSEYVRPRLADKKQVSALEKAFIQFLDSSSSVAGKDVISRHLAVIATDSSVPVLRKLLQNPSTCEMARLVLEKIPGEAADKAFREALLTVGYPYRVGLIDSIGLRRDRKAARLLAPLLFVSDTADAAGNALARIGDREAVDALLSAKTTADERRRAKVQEALMNWADERIAEGKNQAAYLIYRDAVFASEPAQTRVAGLAGLWKAAGVAAVPTLLSALTGGDEQVSRAALRLLFQCQLPDVTRHLIKAYPDLPESAKVQLLAGLADRNDRSASSFVKEVAKSGSDPVRAAGLQALGRLGDASCIQLLAGTAGESSGIVQQAARESLYRMPGQDVDRAIVKALPTASPPIKVELLRAIGERGTREASPALAEAIRDPGPEVRREALKALREVGTEGDLPALLAFVASTEEPGERTEAARTLASACRRSGSGVNQVVNTCSSSTRPEVKEALVGVLGGVGSKEGLPLLKKALNDSEVTVRRAAILALGEWPDAEPMPDLLAAAAAAASLPAHHVLAVRSYLKLLALPAERPSAESVRLVAKAIDTSRDPELKKAALAILPRFVCQEAVELASSAATDPALKAEADQALARLKDALAYR